MTSTLRTTAHTITDAVAAGQLASLTALTWLADAMHRPLWERAELQRATDDTQRAAAQIAVRISEPRDHHERAAVTLRGVRGRGGSGAGRTVHLMPAR